MIRVVVPMGGAERPFNARGDALPKPLVEITGRPLIELVVRNLTPREPHEFIFISRNDYLQAHALGEVLGRVAPGCSIIAMAQPTAAALCSVLLALEQLCHDDELLIAGSDQVLDVPVDRFLATARKAGWDGGSTTFPNRHRLGPRADPEDAGVAAMAEHRPIGCHPTVGIYYVRRARHFVSAARRMVSRNGFVAGELDIAPVFDELVLAGLKIGHFPIPASPMPGLGKRLKALVRAARF